MNKFKEDDGGYVGMNDGGLVRSVAGTVWT